MPYRSVTHDRTTLLCFPPYDEVFTRVAMGHLVAADEEGAERVRPEQLQAALRELFPRAIVRPREQLASLQPGETWYVYRDGRYSPFEDGDPWWDDPETAWIELDDEGRYTAANDAALDLVGIDLATLLTLPPAGLVDPSVSGLVPWVWALVEETGELHSTSILRARPGRPPVGIEFRLARSTGGGWRSAFRKIPVDVASPSDAVDQPADRPAETPVASDA